MGPHSRSMLSLTLLGICGGALWAPELVHLPFAIGERITYEVTTSRAGKVGTATMTVEGPIEVRGVPTYLLRFDSHIRIAMLSADSRSSSWFDPARASSLRFIKHEKNPLNHHDESVDFYPDSLKWRAADGRVGTSQTNTPLDELSFMYFIRTLPLAPATYSFNRHFDVSRNPTTITFVRPEVIPTPMGELKVYLVEMRVHDPAHFKGEGLIRIHLTNNACRIPVRIESTMPVVGTAVLAVTSATSPCTVR
jgi:hypothetical protein